MSETKTETVTASYEFQQTDIPNDTWTQDKLAAFVKSLGKRTMFDRWRIGKALNCIWGHKNKTDRDAWIAQVLPGWSKSTIHRMRMIAQKFPDPDDINENVFNPVTNEEKKQQQAQKREAARAALNMISEMMTAHPKIKHKLEELQKLVEVFAPAQKAHKQQDDEDESA